MPTDDYAAAGLSGEQVMDFAAKVSVWPSQARDLLDAAAPLIAARVRLESDAERDAELAAIADQVERSGPSSAWEAAKLMRHYIAHPTALEEHDQRNAARVRAEERARIDTALRAMPCPDGERPGGRITADEHYRWMTDVLAVVNATTEEATDAA